jgi:hypothetical protein
MLDWLVTLWDKSPPALLAAIAVSAWFGWGEIHSVHDRVIEVSKTVYQTREDMIKGLDELRVSLSDGLNTVARSNEQIATAINTRIDRIEPRRQP